MKERLKRLRGSATTRWRWVTCQNDATDEEKEELIERARVSSPISPAYAFYHPFLMMRAYKQLKRYEGKTWIWPRLAWLLSLVVLGIASVRFIADAPPDESPLDEVIRILVGFYVLPLMVILAAHFVTTVLMRLNETCVWCHIIQRGRNGSIKATLSLMAYRLPFLDPSRTNASPWKGDAEAYWTSNGMDVTLETERDVSQLNFAHIYDETVCWVRRPVAIPPAAKRYVVGKIERYAEINIKEKGRFDLRSRPQLRTLLTNVVAPTFFVVLSLVLGAILRGLSLPGFS